MKKISNIYQYFYYRIFIWNDYLWRSKKKMAAFNSLSAVTFFLYSILCIPILFLNKTFNLKIPVPADDLIFSIIFTFILLTVNISLFENSKKFLFFEKKFKKEKENPVFWKLNGLVVFGTYAGSILLLAYLLQF